MNRRRALFAARSVLGCVFVFAASALNAADVLTVRSPIERQVVQRNGQDRADVTIAGTIEGDVDRIEAKADLTPGAARGTSVDWQVVVKDDSKDGQFTGKLSLTAGGWYTISVRARRGDEVIAESKIAKVGVGDVFITAGQSNSANYGKPRQSAKDDRVVYYDGKAFVPANDPIPGGCGGGGSVWPILGDRIVASQQVPVCFRSASLTWTEVKNWLPGVKYRNLTLYENLVKCVREFGQGGARAVLWHQGESDSLAKTSAEVYCERLKTIIESLNKDAGYDIPWFVAQASFHPGSKEAAETEVARGQQLLWARGIARKGPVTDDLLGKKYRCDGVHLNQLGLRTHAERWFAALGRQYGRKGKAESGERKAGDEGPESEAARAGDGNATSRSPRIVNIINFVRQCEPRIDWITEDVLYETVVQQIESMKRHQLRGTFLLQYDAMIDPKYQKLFKALPPERFEIGVWWEIPQPLVEKAGYQWRGRFPWDWHADVGFATGYSPKEREKLADTYMADFKKIFGYYPKSVGSWFIDAHTLKYMHDRYGIVASCNCKDQIGTDGYTLWGGYWNQGYYPSKKNAYMPAQNADNQIPVPVFRMLGSDPIHQYDSGLGTNHQRVISLEPIYNPGGAGADWCRWYFDTFVDGAATAYGYTQAGQENSFTWRRMGKGFEMQMQMLAQLLADGKITVKTLGETGQWFKNKYKVTPPTSVTVLKDYSEKDQKTVWFNSRFYRANLLWEQGTLRFRDIHLFDESIASDYLTKRGTSSRCDFDTLPLVDGFRWSSSKTVAGLRVKSGDGKEIKGGVPTVDGRAEGDLTVQWPCNSPKGEILIRFNERSATISATGEIKDNWFLELSSDEKADLPFRQIDDRRLSCEYKNAPYVISATEGTFRSEQGRGLRILPQQGRIVLDLSVR